MTPWVRKAALALHVTASVGWLGAVAVFVALAVVGLRADDQDTVRAAYWATDAATRYVIVPLAFGTVLSGLVQSLGTSWGLFRHWWVVVKLVITVVAALVLLQQLEPIGAMADASAIGELRSTRISLDGAGGALVLLVPVVLSIYKAG
jgi:hypothetical protein